MKTENIGKLVDDTLAENATRDVSDAADYELPPDLLHQLMSHFREVSKEEIGIHAIIATGYHYLKNRTLYEATKLEFTKFIEIFSALGYPQPLTSKEEGDVIYDTLYVFAYTIEGKSIDEAIAYHRGETPQQPTALAAAQPI